MTATPSERPSTLWSNVDPIAAFAATYAESQAKFVAAAAHRGAALDTFEHPSARGPDGGTLSVDVAVLGDPDADAALLITSGAHGAEGFCGSGCQVALVADDAFLACVKRCGIAVVFVHAINPWGFAHVARTTEDNVDLNRNFRDFAARKPNDAYLEVHDFVVPSSWPPSPQSEARMAAFVAERGVAALQSAVSCGQADRPDGLFFSGTRPTWSQTVLRAILRRHAAGRRRLGWIDIHTGLGPAGHGEKIFAGPDDPGTIARARAWWGIDVTSIYDGSSTSAPVTGMMFHAAMEECPQAEYAGIALEFGTLPLPAVLHALRARQWLANQGGADVPQREGILKLTRDAFFIDTPAWKGMVVGQARACALQALRGLEGRPA